MTNGKLTANESTNPNFIISVTMDGEKFSMTFPVNESIKYREKKSKTIIYQ